MSYFTFIPSESATYDNAVFNLLSRIELDREDWIADVQEGFIINVAEDLLESDATMSMTPRQMADVIIKKFNAYFEDHDVDEMFTRFELSRIEDLRYDDEFRKFVSDSDFDNAMAAARAYESCDNDE